MDELMSLTPGQFVIMDGKTYVTLETKDGSIVFQEVPNFQQQATANTPNEDTFLTLLSTDETQNSRFEALSSSSSSSYVPVDLSLTNFQVQNDNATDASTNDLQSFQRQQLEDALSSTDPMSLFLQAPNAGEILLEQSLLLMERQVQQDDTVPAANVPTANNAGTHEGVNLSKTSTVDEEEVLAFIQDLQNRGYAVDQNTVDLLLSGEVSLSDVQLVDDNDSNQEASPKDSSDSKIVPCQQIDHGRVQGSNEHSLQTSNSVLENLQIRNDANGPSLANLNRVQTAEERAEEIAVFIQDLNSRGYDLEPETIDLLMSGQVKITDLQFVDETGAPQNFEPTNNNEANARLVEQRNRRAIAEASVPLINVEDDEEFSYFRSQDSQDSLAAGTDSTAPKRQPFQSAFQDVYFNFLEKLKKSRDTSNEPKTTDQSVDESPILEEGEIAFPPDKPHSSRGRGRGGAKFVANDFVQKSCNKEAGYDYSCTNAKPKGHESSSRPSTSGVRGTVKRGAGRPRGSGRKKQDVASDYEFGSDDFESDDSDYSPSKGKRGNRSVGRTSNNRGLAQSQKQRGGKGRGRPRKNAPPARDPNLENLIFASTGDVHNYEIGKFVIKRKDWLQDCGSNVYEIDAGKLLMVYNPIVSNGQIYHLGSSNYTAHAYDIRFCYKAIDVEPSEELSLFYQQPVVKAKLPIYSIVVDIQDDDSLLGIFRMFIEVLCCQNYDSAYLGVIKSGDFEHKYGPLRQMEEIINQCLLSIQSKITWKPFFQETMDSLRFYKIYNIKGRTNIHYLCDETDNPKLRADTIVKFFGPRYDYDILTDSDFGSDVEQLNTSEFFINRSSVEHVRNYHALRHYKITMFKELEFALANKRCKDSKMIDRPAEECIIETCMDTNWIYYHLALFKEMINKAL